VFNLMWSDVNCLVAGVLHWACNMQSYENPLHVMNLQKWETLLQGASNQRLFNKVLMNHVEKLVAVV
jgi:hypothetical protein